MLNPVQEERQSRLTWNGLIIPIKVEIEDIMKKLFTKESGCGENQLFSVIRGMYAGITKHQIRSFLGEQSCQYATNTKVRLRLHCSKLIISVKMDMHSILYV